MKRWTPTLILLAVALAVALIVYISERQEGSAPVVPPPTATQPGAQPPAAAGESQAGEQPPGTALSADAALTLTLVSWNVESGGALQTAVANRIAGFDRVDIWGLSEVLKVDAEAYEFAAEEGENADFDSLLGTTGAADRLLLIWNGDRFERTGGGELMEIALGGRAPLYAQLQDRATGIEFIVMVNHLHRSNVSARHRQARLLNDWAEAQPLPIIAMGDYNFDWDLDDGDRDHDPGYDFLTEDNVFVWLRPADLVTTQCSGWPCRFKSVLDFFFLAGPAQSWNGAAQIVVVDNDFPDDNTTPDHRPVLAVLSTAPFPSWPTARGSANLRAGPGNQFPIVGRTEDGQPLTLVARDESGNWLQLESGEWIATFFVINAPRDLPVVQVTPTPGEPSSPVVTPGPAGLRLGTLFFDGEIPQVESDEYIEIVNDGPALNIAGYTLADDDGSRFTFPDYTMATGESCRVYTNQIHPEFCGFSFGSAQSVWANGGDVVILTDPDGNEIDRACWGSGCE